MSTAASTTLQVRVQTIRYEAPGVFGFELVPLEAGTSLPAFTAGAHIDLHLGNGLVRSYSLLNDPAETHRYRIGVHQAPSSRGGSQWMHEALRPGAVLTISAPRNLFEMAAQAPAHVFVAGGIGITPMLSMMAQATARQQRWRLYYAARREELAAFRDEIQALLAKAQAGAGGEVVYHFDESQGGQVLNLHNVVAAVPEGAHLYCCGPTPMLDAYKAACAALPEERVHFEYFSAGEAPAAEGSYVVELAKSGKTIQIVPGQTLLDGLIEAGAEPLYSCREGICGTCEVRVLCGEVDHRDMVYSNSEKAKNDRMLVCCSGAKGDKLVLDL